jgi:hypothetical protein
MMFSFGGGDPDRMNTASSRVFRPAHASRAEQSHRDTVRKFFADGARSLSWNPDIVDARFD